MKLKFILKITVVLLGISGSSLCSAESASSPSASTVASDVALPTLCSGEAAVWSEPQDSDVFIKPYANLVVMFHGNRFPAAKELVDAFEKKFPNTTVTYTTLPPPSILFKLSAHNTPKSSDKKNSFQKIAAIGYPDVVMVSEANLNAKLYGDALVDPVLYSRISGVVAVLRADDNRINKLEDFTSTSSKFVFPGNHSQRKSLFYRELQNFFGEQYFDQLKKNPTTGYSQLAHHRSIPARILIKCEDIGPQFAQSRLFLEKRFPGKFKFFEISVSDRRIYEEENSYIAVTKMSRNPDAARVFQDFMVGNDGQAILSKYRIGLH